MGRSSTSNRPEAFRMTTTRSTPAKKKVTPPPPQHQQVADLLNASDLLASLRAFRRGDFTVRLPLSHTGMAGEIARAFNDVVEMNEMLALELSRINDVVGKEGRLAYRASLGSVQGAWRSSIESVNALIGDLVQPTTEVG